MQREAPKEIKSSLWFDVIGCCVHSYLFHVGCNKKSSEAHATWAFPDIKNWERPQHFFANWINRLLLGLSLYMNDVTQYVICASYCFIWVAIYSQIIICMQNILIQIIAYHRISTTNYQNYWLENCNLSKNFITNKQ